MSMLMAVLNKEDGVNRNIYYICLENTFVYVLVKQNTLSLLILSLLRKLTEMDINVQDVCSGSSLGPILTERVFQ